MARHKMEKTEIVLGEQKRRWADAHNRRRMIQYNTDPDYRGKMIENSRAEYRKVHNVTLIDCRENLPVLAQIGTVRTVSTPEGAVMEVLTFDVNELAEALGGYNAQIMYRWQQKEQLPRPVVRIHPPRNQAGFVYLEDEVAAIMQHLGAHQSRLRYFRRSDTETIDAIFAAIADVRHEYGISDIA